LAWKKNCGYFTDLSKYKTFTENEISTVDDPCSFFLGGSSKLFFDFI